MNEIAQTKNRTIRKTALSGLNTRFFTPALFTLSFIAALILHSAPSHAFCVVPCDVEWNAAQENILENYIQSQHQDTRTDVNKHTDDDFQKHEDWLVNTLFKEDLLPAFMSLTQQVSATSIFQMEVIGTFLDAKHQLETQRLFGKLTAIAHKDYQPSEGFCTIATMTRSLAGTEQNVSVTRMVLAEHALNRQLANANASSVEPRGNGAGSDRESRFKQFQKRYCDKSDDGGQLGFNSASPSVCFHDATIPANILDKDTDYYRTVGQPMNLNLDFSSAAGTDDETDLFALESNLYSPDIMTTFPESQLKDDAKLQSYLDIRSIVAKRSVAENSFQSIAAMKASGQTSTAMTSTYMQAALQELGIAGPDAAKLIGSNPSYYTQMDVLTRKIFQRPEFFVDLYDKPANIRRKGVELQAISLMQRRDIYESALRTEAMLSVLLELDLMKEQERAQNAADGMR